MVDKNKALRLIEEKDVAIFDLDGVIVDTAKYHYMAWKKLAEILGFSFTEEQNELLKGVSRMRSLDILLQIGGVEANEMIKENYAAKKNQWYIEYISNMGKDEVLPGAREFVGYIKSLGMKTALGSASRNAGLILSKLELNGCFDAIIDGKSVSNAKPDPEVFLKCAGMLGARPQKCIVFEDAKAGVEAAINAGMSVVGIGDPDKLKNADYVVSGLFELVPDKGW